MRKRVTLLAPLTPPQQEVVDLVAEGKNFRECADHLGLKYMTLVDRAREAAHKIPSDLPIWPRIMVWSRGASRRVLLERRMSPRIPDAP